MVVRIRLASLVVVTTLAAFGTIRAQTEEDLNNPTFGAIKENFMMEKAATGVTIVNTFTCSNLGARCVFKADHYTEVDYGEGQETSNAQGAVWAYTTAGNILTLGGCTGDTTGSNECIVTCNANCTCMVDTVSAPVASTLENGTSGGVTAVSRAATSGSCATVVSRAPTVAPKTDAPPEKVCAKAQFVTHCGALMSTLPPGISGNYDCFNFCGGAFVSSCDYSGTCGATDCTNATSVGSLTGQVFGCTKDHLMAFTAANAANTTSSAVAAWMKHSGLALAFGLLSFVL